MIAELHCLNIDGERVASVQVGHEGIEVVDGDLQAARDAIALLAGDPFAATPARERAMWPILAQL